MNFKKTSNILFVFMLLTFGLEYLTLLPGEVVLVSVLIFGASITKSFTKFFTSFFISVIVFSFFNKLISETFLSTPLNELGFVFPIVIILVFAWISKIWHYEISLKDEIISLGAAAIVFLRAFESELTKPGGSITALFSQEDNAAWILAANRVQDTSESSIGIFGPLVDTLFFISHSVSTNIFQNLGEADDTANAIILTYIMIAVLLPFLCNAAIVTNQKRKSNGLSLFILQMGITVIWFHFAQVGHLTAGLASTGLLLVAVRIASLQNDLDKITALARIALIVFLIVIGQSWFPIIPLVVALMFMIGKRQFTPAGTRSLVVFVFSILGSCFLIATEAIPRFSTFRDENGSIFSGAENLLLMEGGVVGTGPITIELVLLIVIVTIIFILRIESLNPIKLLPLTYFWTFLVLIKISNVYITGGAINYGVRKIETMTVLVSFVYCLWIITNELNVLPKGKTQLLLIGMPLFSLLLQVPVSNQIIGKNLFPGLSIYRNGVIAKAISANISKGDSAICINEVHQVEPFSELRMAAYTCSRFVSAYGNRDGLLKNEWRKAVLGAIKYEDLPRVKEDLGEDVILIRLGPANPDLTNNVDWTSLINPNWRQVRAND